MDNQSDRALPLPVTPPITSSTSSTSPYIACLCRVVAVVVEEGEEVVEALAEEVEEEVQILLELLPQLAKAKLQLSLLEMLKPWGNFPKLL